MVRRAEAGLQRTDMRDWVMQRRERTRRLIELGGLVTKAGVDQLLEDDRATLYGMLLDAARLLRGERKEEQATLWKRLGKRTFDAEAELLQAKTVPDVQLDG